MKAGYGTTPPPRLDLELLLIIAMFLFGGVTFLIVAGIGK